jgi:hypothetical protein
MWILMYIHTVILRSTYSHATLAAGGVPLGQTTCVSRTMIKGSVLVCTAQVVCSRGGHWMRRIDNGTV